MGAGDGSKLCPFGVRRVEEGGKVELCFLPLDCPLFPGLLLGMPGILHAANQL